MTNQTLYIAFSTPTHTAVEQSYMTAVSSYRQSVCCRDNLLRIFISAALLPSACRHALHYCTYTHCRYSACSYRISGSLSLVISAHWETAFHERW